MMVEQLGATEAGSIFRPPRPYDPRLNIVCGLVRVFSVDAVNGA